MKTIPAALLALLSVGASGMAFADIPWHGFAFGDDSSPPTLYSISELQGPPPSTGWGSGTQNAKGQSIFDLPGSAWVQDAQGDQFISELNDNGALTVLTPPEWQGRPIHSISWATAINENGYVIGQSIWSGDETDTPENAWLYKNGQYDSIIHGPGRTRAAAVNDLGQVVGTTAIDDFNDEMRGPTAFLWQNGTMYSMDLLEDAASQNWLLDSATGIDDKGDVIGMGRFGENGPEVGFLAVPDAPTAPPVTAIPEPEAYALMLAGLGLLALRRRR